MTEEKQKTAITVRSYMRSPEIMERFKDVLGDEYSARAYIGSVLITVANNQALSECTPMSIAISALKAASLKLSCDISTGQAYLVPFRIKGVPTCTMIIGYKGLYHMALRTNQYRFINNVYEVKEGMVVTEDWVTGRHRIDGQKTSDKTIGYMLSFELRNGFFKTFYMTIEEIHAHAKRYSRSYDIPDSFWKKNTIDMEKKTVLRIGLMKWGYFDPHDVMRMTTADETDDDGYYDGLPEDVTPYVDQPEKPRTEKEIIDALGYDVDVKTGEIKDTEKKKVSRKKSQPTQPELDVKLCDARLHKWPDGASVSSEMAQTIKDSKGNRYIDLPLDKLTYMRNAVVKSLKENGLTDEQRAEQELKRDTAKIILDMGI